MSIGSKKVSNWPTDFNIVKNNLISGFIIFLIALPLSIGISMASGAPPTAGILAAIVGGILGSLVSGSYVTISGPAAGLIVVILEAVNHLGQGDVAKGFKLTLFATVVAGLVQLGMGLGRLGTLGLAVPINALHGLLASIGVIIITKQIFVLGGIKAKAEVILMQIPEFFQRFGELNFEILMIGVVGLVLVIAFNQIKGLSKIIPPALASIIFGYIMSFVVDLEHEHIVDVFGGHFTVGPRFLLNVPVNISEYFLSPLFQVDDVVLFAKCVFTIAFVASIESVLSTYAVDKLDPLKRSSDLNKDLVSKGLCNMILGFIGGIPIISEIVRSTANVGNGGTHRWSNLFHGFFILLFIVVAPGLLNHIPLASFAAVLIFVGYRLANPMQLKAVAHDGKDQLAVFLTTLIVTLCTDLLIGIFAGILLEFIIDVVRAGGVGSVLKLQFESKSSNDRDLINITGAVTFMNMLKIKSLIDKSQAKHIDIDFTKAHFVDFTSKVFIGNYSKSVEGKVVHVKGMALAEAHH